MGLNALSVVFDRSEEFHCNPCGETVTVAVDVTPSVAIEVRVRTAIGLLLVVMALVTGGSVALETVANEPAGDRLHHADMAMLADETTLWPYTSRTTSFDQRTLSINVVIYGPTEYTERLLREETIADWDTLPEDRQDLAPYEEDDTWNDSASTVAWGAADGASRWIWVETPEGDQQWLGEAYQLEDGDYLGHRHHVRAYTDPTADNWTVLQAHTEHWDWFHLRHSVHTIADTQGYVESEFMDQWYVSDLTRQPFGNDGSADADGWVTVVELDEEVLPLVLGIGVIAIAAPLTRRRAQLRALGTDSQVLAGVRIAGAMLAIVGLYLGVRLGAIGLERHMPGLNPKVIVAGFYPILVVGMPAVVYLTTRALDERMAFAAATTGFLLAILVDYTYLQVLRLPLETLVHRTTLAVAVGVLAAGASRTARQRTESRGYVRTGILLWAVAVSVPLFQFI